MIFPPKKCFWFQWFSVIFHFNDFHSKVYFLASAWVFFFSFFFFGFLRRKIWFVIFLLFQYRHSFSYKFPFKYYFSNIAHIWHVVSIFSIFPFLSLWPVGYFKVYYLFTKCLGILQIFPLLIFNLIPFWSNSTLYMTWFL